MRSWASDRCRTSACNMTPFNVWVLPLVLVLLFIGHEAGADQGPGLAKSSMNITHQESGAIARERFRGVKGKMLIISHHDRARFEAKVDRSGGPDACWPWTGSRIPQGYGQFGLWPRTVRAHRAAFVIANGPIPDGPWVLHRCDNPPCCNPAHLFLGSPQDNRSDCMAKGRQAAGARSGPSRHPEQYQGENHGMHVLTEDQVKEIRRLRITRRMFYKDLALMFGISKSAAHAAATGRAWSHLA